MKIGRIALSTGTIVSGTVWVMSLLLCGRLLLKPSGSHFDDLGLIFASTVFATPVLLFGFGFSLVELARRRYTALIGIALSLAWLPVFIFTVQVIQQVKQFQTD